MSAFLFAAAALAAVVGLALLFPGKLLDWLAQFNRPAMLVFRNWGKVPGIVLLLLGAACLTAGLALLRGRRWAWWFAVILFAVNGIGDLISFVVIRDLLRSASGIIVSCLLLSLLINRRAKAFCANTRFGDET